MTQHDQQLSMRRLLAFFLPLGVSSTLVTISHVIINSTLARAPEPELVIASYAIAMSVFGVTERSSVLLRNTSSALVRDRTSFRSLFMVGVYLIIAIILVGLTISYTPVGTWLFKYVLSTEESLLRPVIQNYQILMFVTIFSCIRGIYHGVIITNMRTKWLTFGMIVRLAVMYALASYFITSGKITDARVGAIIFLSGMIVEATISFLEGHSLARKLPQHIEDYEYHTKRAIFKFYRPLMYSAFINVAIGPAINAMLGKTTNIQLAIASFAIAGSVNQLVISFFSYIHQIVLNFYKTNQTIVFRFTLLVSLIPCTLLGILSYTAIGPWFMQTIMGVSPELMQASIATLRVFMLMSLVFPWLDFCNGLILLSGQTKVTVASQSANLGVTFIALVIFVALTPGWNGAIGALAQSLGLAAELGVLIYVIRTLR